MRLGPVAVLLKMNNMKIASSQSEGKAEDRSPVEKKPSPSRDPRKRPSSEEEDFRPAAKKIFTGAEEDVRQVEEAGKGAGPRFGKAGADLRLAASLLEEKLREDREEARLAREEARLAREEAVQAREELRDNRELLREAREALVERTVSEGALREKYEDLVSKLQAKVRERLVFWRRAKTLKGSRLSL